MLVLLEFLPTFQQIIHYDWPPIIRVSISKPNVNNSFRLDIQ